MINQAPTALSSPALGTPGKSIAEDLWDLGLRQVQDLKGQDASTETQDRDPELLKWWNWKEHTKLFKNFSVPS